jgi:hypothetical protein
VSGTGSGRRGRKTYAGATGRAEDMLAAERKRREKGRREQREKDAGVGSRAGEGPWRNNDGYSR